jgi:hypothetical protein
MEACGVSSVDVVAVLAQLAVLEREIISPTSGSAVKAFANVPYSIAAADMPLFVNFAGRLLQMQLVGSDELGRDYTELRQYQLGFYHSPFGTGVGGEKMGLLSPYFDLVYTKFFSYPHLKNMSGIIDAKIVGDTGMGTLLFQSTAYYGISFSLQVLSKVRRLLASGE